MGSRSALRSLHRLGRTGPLPRQSQPSGNFADYLRVGQSQYRAPGIEHNIHWSFQLLPCAADGFSHAAPDAIPFDRAANHLADGKANARTAFHITRVAAATQEKHRHVSRELPAAVLIYPLEVCMFQQMSRFGELVTDGGGHTGLDAGASGNANFVVLMGLTTAPAASGGWKCYARHKTLSL